MSTPKRIVMWRHDSWLASKIALALVIALWARQVDDLVNKPLTTLSHDGLIFCVMTFCLQLLDNLINFLFQIGVGIFIVSQFFIACSMCFLVSSETLYFLVIFSRLLYAQQSLHFLVFLLCLRFRRCFVCSQFSRNIELAWLSVATQISLCSSLCWASRLLLYLLL